MLKKLRNLTDKQVIVLQICLLLTTIITTTMAGIEWIYGMKEITWDMLLNGLYFSLSFLGILTVHEFGHYFTARYYKLKVSLPFYIPLWFFGLTLSIGTMGAFIKIKSPLKTRKEFFDVGFSGPLAGFIVACGVLYYGFTHLPPIEYIYQFHPEYEQWGADYAKYAYENLPENTNLMIGTNLLFEFFKVYVVEDPSLIPNPHEMMHYPFLMAGFFACFFTALNLIPIGQLDGGHILFAQLGSKHFHKVVPYLFITLLFFAGLGIFSMRDSFDSVFLYAPLYIYFLYWVLGRLYQSKMQTLLVAVSIFTAQFVIKSFIPQVEGYPAWLLFGLIIGRFIGIKHPPVLYDEPLGWKRKIIGVLSLVVFILCFSPAPFILE